MVGAERDGRSKSIYRSSPAVMNVVKRALTSTARLASTSRTRPIRAVVKS